MWCFIILCGLLFGVECSTDLSGAVNALVDKVEAFWSGLGLQQCTSCLSNSYSGICGPSIQSGAQLYNNNCF